MNQIERLKELAANIWMPIYLREVIEAAVAAHSWNYDMDSAPRDGSSVLLKSGYGETARSIEGCWRNECFWLDGTTLCQAGWVWVGDPDVPKPYLDAECWKPMPTPPEPEAK